MFKEKNYPLILCGLSCVLFLFGLGWRDFWAPVEPRYAEIARIMFAKGEWIVPMVNGELYTDKPILYFWLVMIAAKLFGGVNEWTVRLPAALGGVGFVWITYLFGKEFFSARAGFLSAVVLATSMRVIWEARWVHVDMVFCLFFMLSIYFAARALFNRGSANQMLLAYVFMALATLTKGLIGVVLPALLLLCFVAGRRDWQMIGKARLPTGIALFLLVAAPWFYWVNRATDGRWLSEFIFIHHLQRYTAGAGHRQPVYYYLTTLPVDLLPWTVFVIPALLAYRPFSKVWREPKLLFCVLWFATVFVFFTASDTKRELYLLPLLPVVALLIGHYLSDLASNQIGYNALSRWLVSGNFALIAIMGIGMPITALFFHREVFWPVLGGSVALAFGGACLLRFSWQRQPLKVIASVTLMMALLLVSSTLWMFPYLEALKSRRAFADEIKSVVPSSTPLYIYADTMHDFNFYLEREVVAVLSSPVEIENLRRATARSYLLIKQRDLNRLSLITPQQVIRKSAGGSNTWNLIELKADQSG